MRAKIDNIDATKDRIDIIEKAGLNKTFYGLVNPKEFMAEAFTNPRFQIFLSKIEVELTAPLTRLGGVKQGFKEGRVSSLLKSFLNSIKKFLGYSVRNSLLNEILFITDENFTTQSQLDSIIDDVNSGKKTTMAVLLEKELITREASEDSDVVPMATTTNDVVDESLRSVEGIGGMYKSIKEAVGKVGGVTAGSLNLAYSNRDVIERNHRALFTKAAMTVFKTLTNPLTQYVKEKQRASVIARKYERKGYLILRRVMKLKNKTRSKMYALMRNTTLAQVWPDKPLNHPANKHLWSKPNEKTGVTTLKPKTAKMAKDARREWLALNKSDPEAAALMMDMAALTKEIQKAKQDSAFGALGASFDLSVAQIAELQRAETAEDIEELFHHSDDALLKRFKIGKGDSDERKKAKRDVLTTEKDSH